jgi:protein-S-isoprenylcysteine O-methyltransferase Ste14
VSEKEGPLASTLWIAFRASFYATAFVLLFVWLGLAARRFDDRLRIGIPGWLQPIGWIIGACGAVVALSCIVYFVKEGRGTPALFDSPREFVANGPYRYVRNPMYVGGLSVILGAGLALGSLSIVLLALLFWLGTHVLVVAYEERTLERRFGASYLSYKGRVNRWLPRAPALSPKHPPV